MQRYLIVGLGNPGKKYIGTRHNIGFHIVEELAETHGLHFDTNQSDAQLADGTITGQRVLLVKPQTYMNNSGQALRALVDFYKIPLDKIIVAYDDLDIDLGVLRLRSQGGAGGHNGLRSTINHLGSQDFARLRFGIGRPPGRMDPSAYVLRPFLEEERPLALETLHRATRALETWLRDGIEQAMNQHNGTAEEVAERQRQASSTVDSTPPSTD